VAEKEVTCVNLVYAESILEIWLVRGVYRVLKSHLGNMSLYSDPISDMLTRIRNASAIRRAQVVMPHSRLKEALAEVLVSEGFLGTAKKEIQDDKPQLVINLNYSTEPEKQPAIRGLERISKPGQRIYMPSKKIRPVLQGLGMSVVSTPKGLMTDSQARKQGLGGELICRVW